MKNKVTTILIIIATIILAGIAVFTAIRLYQLRKQAVAPTAPEEPGAQVFETPEPTYQACSTLAFTISTPAPGVCNSTCNTNSDCASNYCYTVPCPTGENCITLVQKYCRNASCPGETDCTCTQATATATARATATPTAQATATATATVRPTGTATSQATSTPIPTAELPDAGMALPTYIGLGAGVILLIIALALAL